MNSSDLPMDCSVGLLASRSMTLAPSDEFSKLSFVFFEDNELSLNSSSAFLASRSAILELAKELFALSSRLAHRARTYNVRAESPPTNALGM